MTVIRRRRLPLGFSPRTLLCLLAMLMAACASQECSCEGFETTPFPTQHYDKTVPQGAQIRVSPTGLGFIEENIGPLIDEALPGGLGFCLPKSPSGDTELCFPYVRDRNGYHEEGDQPLCEDGSEGCQLSLTIEDTELLTAPPDKLQLSVTVGNLNPTIPFKAKVVGITVRCDVTPYKRGADKNTPATVRALVPIRFSIDEMSATKDLRLDIEETAFDLNQLDFDLKGGFTCTVADTLRGLFRGMLEGQIRDQLSATIDDLVRSNLCAPCDGSGGCAQQGASCAEDNICDYSPGECVPLALGVEGRASLGAILGDFTTTPDASLDLFFKLGDHVNVDTGLTLAARTGFQPQTLSECVPIDPTTRPSFDTVPLSATILGDVHPGTSEPFHLGIGIHKGTIEHALWSAWASGATCLGVDSSSIEQLSTGALSIFLPSLGELTETPGQAALVIVPQQAPRITLGANRVSETAQGYEVEEGLFDLDWRDLDLHLYAWVLDRWTRVATVRMDLLLPMAVVPNGAGRVEVALGDVEAALKNLRGRNGELLREDPNQLAALIPTLIGVALPSLADSLQIGFDLPEVFGLRLALKQGDILSVDDGEFIALLANLEAGGAPTDSLILPTPRIDAAEVSYPEPQQGAIMRPVVALKLGASLTRGPIARELVAGSEVEYAWRIDGGFWSLYSKLDEIAIRDPVLALPGEHHLEVRARVAGSERWVNHEELATTTLRIDYQAPTLRLERQGAVVKIEATDLTDSPEQLRHRYRLHDGERARSWSAWGVEREIDLSAHDLPGDVRVEVESQDRAGLIANAQLTVRAESFEIASGTTEISPTTSSTSTSSACSQAPSGSSQGGPWGVALSLLALGALCGVRRRRGARKRLREALTALVGLAVVGSTGCSNCGDQAANNSGNNATACASPCAPGEVCEQGQCVPRSCQTEAECEAGQRCEQSVCVEPECREAADCASRCGEGELASCEQSACVCEASCPEGCGEGEFCCQTANACQPLPDPCDGQVCEPGFKPSVQAAGQVDAASCSLTGAACECVEADPLPLGRYGSHGDVVVGADETFVSAYNATYGDVMVGQISSAQAFMTWQFVDGVPLDGAVTGSPNGPRGGVAAGGPRVGEYTALTIDDLGTLHLFYRDARAKALKYARGDRSDGGGQISWQITTLASARGSNGLYNDAVFHDGRVHVVTLLDGIEAEEGSTLNTSEFRHLQLDPSAPLDALDFDAQSEVVVSGPASSPCATACADGALCERFSGACVTPDEACATPRSCSSGSACYQDVCVAIHNPTLPAGPSMAAASYPDLSVTPAGGLLLAFYRGAMSNVAVIERSPDGAWKRALYPDSGGSGPYVSARMDEENDIHIAYMHKPSSALHYKVLHNEVVLLEIGNPSETIAQGLRDTGDEWLMTRIGEDVTLHLDAAGQPEVTFQDATLHRLIHARRKDSGSWTMTTISQQSEPFEGSRGFYPTSWRVGDEGFALEYVIDRQASPERAYPVAHRLP